MDADISSDPSDYSDLDSDLDDDSASLTDNMQCDQKPIENKSISRISIKKYEESSDEFSAQDNDSSYSYSAEPSYSDDEIDDYFPKSLYSDIKPLKIETFKPLSNNNTNNTNNHNINNINKNKNNNTNIIEAIISSMPTISNINPLSITNINNNNNNNNNNKIKKCKQDSSNKYIDKNESEYSYSSDPSHSDDDYLLNQIKLESSLYSASTNNNNNNNNNNNSNNNKYPSSSSSVTTTTRNSTKNKIFKKERFQHTIKEEIKCEICCDIFQYHSLYRKHMNKMHRICKPYVCDRCPKNDRKRYQTKSSLDIHIEKHHEGVRNYECSVCHKAFYEKFAWKQHEKIHDNQPRIPCELCKVIFTEHTKWRKHQNQIHNIEQPYVCKKCPSDKAPKYRSKAGLTKHIKRDHEGERNHKCSLCGKAFHEKQTLNAHYRVHDGLKPYRCPHCDMRFTQHSSKRQHVIVIHMKQKNYKCKFCGKRFPSSSGMKSHLVSQHNDDKYTRFQCKICHKRFYEKGWYFKHIDNVHRPKDPKKEMIKKGECYYPNCKKKYIGNKCAESLKYHLVHTHKDREYAKYECKKCEKLFYDKTSHTKHMENKHKLKKRKK